MPALVNYTGDDEFYSGGSIYSMDSSLSCGMYYPPSKRARISSPYASSGNMFEEEKTPSIEVLPDECLFEIFRRLQGGQARSASACVSKRWLTLLTSVRTSEICRSNVNVSSNDVDMISNKEDTELDGYLTRCLEGEKATDIRLAAIAVGTANRGGLGKLSIRGSNSIRGVTDLGLTAIARGCPSLKTLSLWNVPSIGDEGLVEIGKECHLDKLDLSYCPLISNKGLIAIARNSPNLNALTIESCPKIGNEGLQAIARCCPKLQSIIIRDCPLVGDQGVASLLSSASSVLTKVKLQALSITDFSLAVIGHYGKVITSLILSGLQNVSEKGFWVMGTAKGLERLSSLTISSCRGTTDASLEAIGKGCPNLKLMCLRKCCFVSDGGLVAFAKAAGSLESLQLEECNRITQTGILGALSNCGSKLKSLSLAKCMGIKDLAVETTPFLSPCESLRCLSIRSCPYFGSSSFAMVGKLCPNLSHLDLSGFCGITDDGLLPLVESCVAGLVKVNLSGCSNLTDLAVSAIARLHGGTLQVLNLDGCSQITDKTLMAIADNCLVLNDLDVSKCLVTDCGIAALSCGEKLNLKILSLSGCLKVSNHCLPSLLRLGETLVGLNLQHCNSVSNTTVELLVEHLLRCNILS